MRSFVSQLAVSIVFMASACADEALAPEVPDDASVSDGFMPDARSDAGADGDAATSPDAASDASTPDSGADAGLVCTDLDEDGFAVEGGGCGPVDCRDDAEWIHPEAEEICNGVDDDCDRGIDEGQPEDCVPCIFLEHAVCAEGDVRPCGTDRGECVRGHEACDASGQWSGRCEGGVTARPEVPNGLDDDCDGAADQGLWPLPTVCPTPGAALRVDPRAPPGGDGTSWPMAFDALATAVAAAAACDELWVASGTIAVQSAVPITTPIQIFGGFAGVEVVREQRDPVANPTVVSGGAQTQCFDVHADTLMDGLQIAGCSNATTLAGGAVQVSGATLRATDVLFRGNRTTRRDSVGGAIAGEAGAFVALERARFEDNRAQYCGGAVSVRNASALVVSSGFYANAAEQNWTFGGALFADRSPVTVIDSDFEDNSGSGTGTGQGGAISASGWEGGPTEPLHVISSRFRRNWGGWGDAIHVRTGTVTLHGSTIEEHGRAFRGSNDGHFAAVYITEDGTLIARDSTFANNHHGAVFSDGRNATASTIDAEDCRFLSNSVTMVMYTSWLYLRNCEIVDDVSYFRTSYLAGVAGTISDTLFSGNQGRALEFRRGIMRLERNRFIGNRGHFFGGALHLDARSEIDVVDSVFADNFVTKSGALAFVDDGSVLRLANVTATENYNARTEWSILRTDYQGAVEATNSVFWGNWPRTAQGGATITYSALPHEGGRWSAPADHNTIGDPSLMSPTTFDFRLDPRSPIIDTGTTAVASPPGLSARDLEGRLRNLDGDGDGRPAPDPGAIEYTAPVPNRPPIAAALDGLRVPANGYPLSVAPLFGGRSCDPERSPLEYRWVGPRGAIEGREPRAELPEGRSLLTLFVSDGELRSNPASIEVDVEPCQHLSARSQGGVVTLEWPRAGPATVLRAPAAQPFAFEPVAANATSPFEDRPEAADRVVLYVVLSEACASSVAAAHAETAPANAPPVVYSQPANHVAPASWGGELVGGAQALFDVPWGYQVRAVDPDADAVQFDLRSAPASASFDASTGWLTWLPDEVGVFDVNVAVSDPSGAETEHTFQLYVDNRAPTANAGADITLVEIGRTVRLDGSRSHDPDGQPLTYEWTLVHAPYGSGASLSDSSAAQPSLTLDVLGQYVLALIVSDGELVSAEDYVYLETLDLRPVAVTTYQNGVGEYQSTHHRGDVVQLDGTESWDPEGEPLTYRWVWTTKPEASAATLDNPTSPTPTFVVDVDGEYSLRLYVHDGAKESFYNRSHFASRNQEPVGVLGPDRGAATGETVNFSCDDSYDPDGDPIECEWYLWPPAGSQVTLGGLSGPGWVDAEEIHFVPDVAGDYQVDLRAIDSFGAVDWVDVTLSVVSNERPPTIVSSPPRTAHEGVAWTYPAQATDPNPGALAWSLDTAPSGMSAGSASGQLLWTPTRHQRGAQEVLLRVTDPTGQSDTQRFTVEVSPTPRSPRIGCPGSIRGLAGRALVTQLAGHHPNGLPFVFERVSGPAGLAVLSSGLVTWTPSAQGSFPVQARVVDGQGQARTCGFTVEVLDLTEQDADFDGVSVAAGDCDDHDPTRYPGAFDVALDGVDQDCAGGDAARSVRGEGPTETRVLPVGETTLIPHVFYARRGDAVSGGLQLTRTVTPSNGGLAVDMLPATLPAKRGSATIPTELRVAAVTPGTYELTSTLADTVTGQRAVVTTEIEVPTLPARAKILAPQMYPGAVPVESLVPLDVSVHVRDVRNPPPWIRLDETDGSGVFIRVAGWLQDDGHGRDLQARDGVYTGFTSAFSATEGPLFFRAEIPTAPGRALAVSALASVQVTRFDVGAPETDLDDIVYSPTTAEPWHAAQLEVTFLPGAAPADIEAAAAALGANVTGLLPAFDVHILSFPSADSGAELEARLTTTLAHPQVLDATPVGILRALAVPIGDPLFSTEAWWAFDIQTRAAWVFGLGGGGGRIAVIDTGIDHHHPELRGQFASSSNTLCRMGGCLGVEDDNNHGTFVTGIIVAADNEVGLLGVAPESEVLVVKSLDHEGRGTSAQVSDGVSAALARGATLLNMSLGYYSSHSRSTMRRASARAHRQDALIIAAAGNEDTHRRLYPAAARDSVSVGGLGVIPTERWVDLSTSAAGSNYGASLDLAAPAELVFGPHATYDTGAYSASAECVNWQELNLPRLTSERRRRHLGCYDSGNGTSLAAPMVAGGAELLLDRLPYLTPDQVKARLKATAKPLTSTKAAGLGDGALDLGALVFNGGFEAEEYEHDALAFADSGLSPVAEWDRWPPGDPAGVTYHYPNYHWPRPAQHGWHLLRFSGYRSCVFRQSVDPVPGAVRVRELGDLRPPSGEYMAMISTGREGEDGDSILDTDPSTGHYWDAHFMDILMQRFTLAPGQSSITITGRYDFITEEHILRLLFGRRTPACDHFQVILERPSRREVLLSLRADDLIQSGTLTIAPGVSLAEGQDALHTGWTPFTHTATLAAGETGPFTLMFEVWDCQGRSRDTVVLIDDVSIR